MIVFIDLTRWSQAFYDKVLNLFLINGVDRGTQKIFLAGSRYASVPKILKLTAHADPLGKKENIPFRNNEP